MSNVLIAIIATVLFIGMALAGALILGDDFKTSDVETRVTAVMGQMHQAANAASMYNVKTGGRVASGTLTSSAMMGRFLKSAPVNPSTVPGSTTLYDASGGAVGPAVILGMVMRDAPNDLPVCESIQRSTGMIAPLAAYDATVRTVAEMNALPASSGCSNVVDATRFMVFTKF